MYLLFYLNKIFVKSIKISYLDYVFINIDIIKLDII